jgi:antitoxin MazE
MAILASMKTRLQKWGNSLGLRIPKALAQQATVEPGSVVELTIDNQRRLIVERVAGPEYSLDELLAQVTNENVHAEWPTARRRGREAW